MYKFNILGGVLGVIPTLKPCHVKHDVYFSWNNPNRHEHGALLTLIKQAGGLYGS